ncbi:GNAT family N-acetyltransferase [Actinoplanes sp. LDG1-06]|uniref:GNAT family N-acetyltransferase n=1 Tax=Paractinoplanes ovalisporus TaxID=2810368 RepID=A0ABS2AF97_9ACTN|nr:GNAT family N-acetyltransferase [Actinoplanes ovalisporus]MBM2618489.1 GNAT family N-acetyltransferase [Actinoplanes ovalisporus]
MRLERLAPGHAPALLRFETENREWFARFITDRGDEYFDRFAEHHAALLAEQEAGVCHFHVLMDGDEVVGRFNLVDVEDGAAELGFRVAAAAAGRGVATEGVRLVCELARDAYGLSRLTADAGVTNAASRAVLGRSGFVPVGDCVRGGRPAVRHVLELADPGPSGEDPATVPG